MKRRERSLVEGLAARLERSQHVFLLGVVVAFAVEILVDWNSTFYEINVLRAQLGNKAMNYAAVLRLSLEEVIAGGDGARGRALAERVCEDPEVAGVHIVRADGTLIAEAADSGGSLAARFPRQLARDEKAMMADPDLFRSKQRQSRHRDVFQSITDGEDNLLRKILPERWTAQAPPAPGAEGLALQDRLYEEKSGEKRDEQGVVWALGLVEKPESAAGLLGQAQPGGRTDSAGPARPTEPGGVVLVALRTDALRAGIRKKLIKGLVITVFFLCVILMQQVSARRSKMRLLSLSDALAAAREALAAALPDAVPTVDGMEGGLAFEQSERLGGTIFDLKASDDNSALTVFVALPEGSGVDVAFASIYLRDEHKRQRRENPQATPSELLFALAAAYTEAPIHRRVEMAIFVVDVAAGMVRGVIAGIDPPSVLDENGAPVAAQVSALSAPATPAIDLASFGTPLLQFEIAFPPGALLLVYHDGLPAGAHHPLSRAEILHQAIAKPAHAATEIADDLRKQTLKRAGALTDDLLVLALKRHRQAV